jgi:hypothetical protein
MNVLFEVADDEVLEDDCSDSNDVLLLALLIGKVVKDLGYFHKHKFFKVNIGKSCLLVQSLFITV